jgi:phosphoacetylglucosamine mutase
LVDPYGEMLEASWEAYATTFANAKDEEELIEAIKKVVKAQEIDLKTKSIVIQARDTRYSR